jgi:hypothetical protein
MKNKKTLSEIIPTDFFLLGLSSILAELIKLIAAANHAFVSSYQWAVYLLEADY